MIDLLVVCSRVDVLLFLLVLMLMFLLNVLLVFLFYVLLDVLLRYFWKLFDVLDLLLWKIMLIGVGGRLVLELRVWICGLFYMVMVLLKILVVVGLLRFSVFMFLIL